MRDALTALRRTVSGAVVTADDADYERLRRAFTHARLPAVIVRTRTADDVRAAIAFARAHGLVVSVRSGGHSPAGFGTNDGGVVIDVSPMDEVRVLDAATGAVRVGAGATWIGVAEELGRHGLAFSSGDTTSVGVAGLLLGGGIGWMVRKHGLALDNVVAVELVTAAGALVRADAGENPELFWALRGGGGNFGVAVAFEIVAHPLDAVHYGTIDYDPADTPGMLRRWRDHMRTATDDLTTSVRVFPTFGADEQPPVNMGVCFAGGDEHAAKAAVQPLLGLGTVVADDIARVPYARALDDPSDVPPTWEPRGANRLTADFDDALIEALVAGIRRFDSMYVELRWLGGAFGRVPQDATAFAHRDGEVMILATLLGTAEENRALAEEYAAFWRSLGDRLDGAYANFLSDFDAEDIAACFPQATYRRLAAVKRDYDPDNVFTRNANILPAQRTDGGARTDNDNVPTRD